MARNATAVLPPNPQGRPDEWAVLNRGRTEASAPALAAGPPSVAPGGAPAVGWPFHQTLLLQTFPFAADNRKHNR